LEQEVVREFYHRDKNGIPVAWVARMRESMARLTPRFSASRTVREYTEKHYIPAATNYRFRVAAKGAAGRQIIDWRRKLEEKWPKARLGELKRETIGDQYRFEIEVFLNELDSGAVQVELYADGGTGNAAVRHEMTLAARKVSEAGSLVYSATLSAPVSPAEFTVRMMPRFEGVSVPLEEKRILWQR
jgi:starch phosphorylase